MSKTRLTIAYLAITTTIALIAVIITVNQYRHQRREKAVLRHATGLAMEKAAKQSGFLFHEDLVDAWAQASEEKNGVPA